MKYIVMDIFVNKEIVQRNTYLNSEVKELMDLFNITKNKVEIEKELNKTLLSNKEYGVFSDTFVTIYESETYLTNMNNSFYSTDVIEALLVENVLGLEMTYSFRKKVGSFLKDKNKEYYKGIYKGECVLLTKLTDIGTTITIPNEYIEQALKLLKENNIDWS